MMAATQDEVSFSLNFRYGGAWIELFMVVELVDTGKHSDMLGLPIFQSQGCA
jgi:hypothetical protein